MGSCEFPPGRTPGHHAHDRFYAPTSGTQRDAYRRTASVPQHGSRQLTFSPPFGRGKNCRSALTVRARYSMIFRPMPRGEPSVGNPTPSSATVMLTAPASCPQRIWMERARL